LAASDSSPRISAALFKRAAVVPASRRQGKSSLTPPTRAELLSALAACARGETAPSRQGRRDALLAICWICLRDEIEAGRLDANSASAGVLPKPILAADDVLPPKLLPQQQLEPQLVELIADCGISGMEDLQLMALLVLATWAERSETHPAIVQSHALRALKLAMQVPSTKANAYGARALACLSSNPSNFPLLIREGAVDPLLRLISSKAPSIRRHASRALCNLSKHNDAARELHRLDATAALIKTLRAAPDDRKLICKLQPVPSGGQLNLQTNDDVGDNELDLHKEYLELTLRNLKVVWAVEDEQLVHQAKAAAALRSQYIQLAQHFKLSRADEAQSKWSRLWVGDVYTRLLTQDRCIKGTAFAGWWFVVQLEMMRRQEISSPPELRLQAAVTLQRFGRGAITRSRLKFHQCNRLSATQIACSGWRQKNTRRSSTKKIIR